MPSFKGNLLTKLHKITQQTGDPMLSYGKNPECLSHLDLDRYRDMTDTRTDGWTDRQTELR